MELDICGVKNDEGNDVEEKSAGYGRLNFPLHGLKSASDLGFSVYSMA